MRGIAATVILLGLITIPLGAQGRGRSGDRAQGIPPGHLPRPGECRVWYDGRPPGQQPPPMNCRDAERIASRNRYARVIYGDQREGQGNRRAIPRREPSGYPYPDRYPYPDSRYPDRDRDGRGAYGYERVSFDNGYKDGYDKGRDDARRNAAYDPARHSWYRSADRGYDRRYGSREEYRNLYRDGFRAGYDDGYRDRNVYGSDDRRGGSRVPWPF